jgi:chromosome partitioning protein
MRTVVIASSKGGTGKSTIAAHLAVEADKQGDGLVAVVDTDSQGSLSAWWNAREASTPLFAAVEVTALDTHLTALAEHGVNLVVIDTPPALSETIHRAIASADLVIIPVRPSPHDLRAVAVVVDVVEGAGKPFVFVINGATPRSTIALDALRALAQHGKVAPSMLHHRIDFATSMIDGRTVGELNHKSRSACEVAELWVYVKTQLRKVSRGREHGSESKKNPRTT